VQEKEEEKPTKKPKREGSREGILSEERGALGVKEMKSGERVLSKRISVIKGKWGGGRKNGPKKYTEENIGK